MTESTVTPGYRIAIQTSFNRQGEPACTAFSKHLRDPAVGRSPLLSPQPHQPAPASGQRDQLPAPMWWCSSIRGWPRCSAGWSSMTTRQAGHFFFEPKHYDVINQATHEHKEEIKVGYNLQRKVVLMAIWAASPLLLFADPTLFGLVNAATSTRGFPAQCRQALADRRRRRPAVPHRAAVLHQGRQTGLVWMTKILTDPFHDIMLYWKSPLYLLRGELIDPRHSLHGVERRGRGLAASAAPDSAPAQSTTRSGALRRKRSRQHLPQDRAPDRLVGRGRAGHHQPSACIALAAATKRSATASKSASV